MEKRFIIAIILSFIVLYIWSGLTQTSRQREKISNNIQVLENKRDTVVQSDNFSSNDHSMPNTAQVASKDKEIIEQVEQLESEKLILEFSNIGGVLKKLFLKEYQATLPITNVLNVWGYEDAVFIVQEVGRHNITYVYEDDEYKISKRYQVLDNDYIVHSEITFQNKSDMSKNKDITIGGYIVDSSSMDIKNKKNPSAARDKGLLEYVVYSNQGMHRKNNAYKFSTKESLQEKGKVRWVGFRNRYYCALIKPEYEAYGYAITPINNEKLKVDIESRGIKIPKGGEASFSYKIFFGPERLDLLKTYKSEFEKVKRYYRFGLFDVVAKLIYEIIHFFHRIIPNWGVCILLISILIYFSMYPLTLRSMQSMKNMQAVQPKVVKLKEKYKDNPQKMNKEMMALYKTHKVNPLGGCLPMLFQMPVFIGLYQVLWRSVSLKGASFLWIQDLSAPDRLFTFSKSLPLIGNEFNLLPVIMMVVMFFQQKLSAQNMVASDPSQVAQQKMMGRIMPLFLGFIFYKFASGLTLYFTMFYMFSALTQWKMNKKPTPKVV